MAEAGRADLAALGDDIVLIEEHDPDPEARWQSILDLLATAGLSDS